MTKITAAGMLEPTRYAPTTGDIWQRQVHALMRRGLGFDDVAVELGCRADAVRAEAEILRAEGRLDAMYRGKA